MAFDSHIPGVGAGPLPTGATTAAGKSDGETAEKGSFLATLEEIREKGLRAYAEEQQVKKLEEMHKKILESMGLTEDDLAAMSPEQRAAVERMVDTEIEKRLAARSLIEKGDEPVDPADLDRALPNGLGSGMLMIQAMEAAREQE